VVPGTQGPLGEAQRDSLEPVKNKAIASAKVKTDKIDSITLANLLRGGWAAECYVPSKMTMEFRELVRFRVNPVRQRTRMKEGYTPTCS